MICDEGHRLKNDKVKVFKALMDLKCRSRIIVTGTPIQNNLGELYSCIRFVYPQFKYNFDVFKKKFIDPINMALQKNSTQAEKEEAEEKSRELSQIVGSMMLRRNESVL